MKSNTINLKGKSGKSYIFHIYKLPAKLTKVGGVYLYLKALKSNDFKVISIGNTHDFSEEMENYEIKSNKNATHIAAYQKNAKAKRELVSKDLKHLKS